MSPELVGLIGIIVLLVLLAFRMWIAAAMAFVGFIGTVYIKGLDQALISVESQSFKNIASYTISVLPMFLMMGNIIAQMGIGTDLYNGAYKWFGHRKGGLSIATTLACAGLAAISGTSAPALATMSKVALPEMKKYKYDETLANGCIVSAAGLGPLIPPSMPMIMYGILAEQSIGQLFIAGILPGILLSVLFIITILIYVKVRPDSGPAGPKFSFMEKIYSLKNIWHVILLFILVLGGIYAGVCTPTEAGAIGALGSLLIIVLMGRFTVRSFISVLKDTVLMSGMILTMMAGTFIFINFMAVSKLPYFMGNLITGLHAAPMTILIAIMIIYIFLGMFMDILTVIMLTIPIVVPVVSALGFDLVWFGIFLVLMLEMGLLTPPVGMDVYFFSGMTGIPVEKIFKGVWPFVLAMFVCVVLVIIFPQIALVLVR